MGNQDRIFSEIQGAELSGDDLLLAEACLKAGKLFLERNIHPEAIHYLRKAAELFADKGKPIQQAQSLNQLSVCLVFTNQAEIALLELAAAKKCLAGIDHPTLSAAIEGNIGLAYSELEDYRNAAKHHKIVHEAALAISDQSLALNALINLADCNFQDNKYQPALGFALVALDLAKSLESQSSLVIIYDLLGMISSRQGDLKTALDFHQQSLDLARGLGDLLRQGTALANQALAREGLLDLDLACRLMTEAQEIFILLNSDYQEKTRKDLSRIQQRLADGG